MKDCIFLQKKKKMMDAIGLTNMTNWQPKSKSTAKPGSSVCCK